HSKDTHMFTIQERIEIVAARLRGQSYEEVRDRFQMKPSQETCILTCCNFSYSHSYSKMVSQKVDWKGISSYLDTSFARPRTTGLFAWG
ncbi:hypothetical protein L9F63_024846, partial [Diploptera punctata]